MKAPQRVKAFTIMELTVAMLISAIVIAITYTAYNIISRSYLDYQRKHEEMALLIRLNELLRRDFSRSEQVSANEETYTFADSSKTVAYRFAPGQVLRKDAGLTDTFRLELSRVKAAFEGKVIEEGVETGQLPANDNADGIRIDELSFQVLYQKQTFPYHYHKQYSAQTLLNADPHAFH